LANSLAVINCSQVVTLAGAKRARTRGDLRQLAIIEDGGLLIRDGRIEAVGRRREIEALIDADCEVVDAGKRIVLPGFVDAHAHPVFAGNRANEFEQRTAGATYREIAARGGGIRATVRATRNASPGDLVKAGKRYAEWFLRCGNNYRGSKVGLWPYPRRRTEDPAGH
jgi:imidazolonepropionase